MFQVGLGWNELRTCRWAAALWCRDDIARMAIVAIQPVNAYRDLVIRILFTARGMADGDRVITDCSRGRRAARLRHWDEVAFMIAMTI